MPDSCDGCAQGCWGWSGCSGQRDRTAEANSLLRWCFAKETTNQIFNNSMQWATRDENLWRLRHEQQQGIRITSGRRLATIKQQRCVRCFYYQCMEVGAQHGSTKPTTARLHLTCCSNAWVVFAGWSMNLCIFKQVMLLQLLVNFQPIFLHLRLLTLGEVIILIVNGAALVKFVSETQLVNKLLRVQWSRKERHLRSSFISLMLQDEHWTT